MAPGRMASMRCQLPLASSIVDADGWHAEGGGMRKWWRCLSRHWQPRRALGRALLEHSSKLPVKHAQWRMSVEAYGYAGKKACGTRTSAVPVLTANVALHSLLRPLIQRYTPGRRRPQRSNPILHRIDSTARCTTSHLSRLAQPRATRLPQCRTMKAKPNCTHRWVDS
eukprot:scaffold8134_cov138-Isochrysis_galbana.AAC.4